MFQLYFATAIVTAEIHGCFFLGLTVRPIHCARIRTEKEFFIFVVTPCMFLSYLIIYKIL